MNSTHMNDVVFTRDSLNKFIKLIKTEGIKNLDYYIMSPDMSVLNVLLKPEFSLGEKTIFNGNLAIVNKSYYNVNPYEILDIDNNEYKTILRYNLANIFHVPDNMLDLKDDDLFSEQSTTNENSVCSGTISINFPIDNSNYNFVVDSINQKFACMLDSNINYIANSILKYTLIQKESDNEYSYLNKDRELNIDLNEYNKFIPIPYSFSSVNNNIKQYDGITNYTTDTILCQTIDNNFNDILHSEDQFYYQGLQTTTYKKFQNLSGDIDIFTYKLSNSQLTTNYAAFEEDRNDPLLKAFQAERINNIEENNFQETKQSNYYQIFWDHNSNHLLQNINISYGYNESGTSATVQKVGLFYNDCIPIKSIKIKSWEPLHLTDNIKTFPNIENKGYSYPTNKNNTTIFGKWQPNDLINLFSNYQIMKQKEEENEDLDITNVRAYSTTKNNNAHEVAFTPNIFEKGLIDSSIYYENADATATYYQSYNQFEYIVLDAPINTNLVVNTVAISDTIGAFKTNLDDSSATALTAVQSVSATVSSTTNTALDIEYYYITSNSAISCRADTSKNAPLYKNTTTATISITNNTLTFPVQSSSYNHYLSWRMQYNPKIMSISATINTATNSTMDDVTKITFDFSTIEKKTGNQPQATADIGINIEYIISNARSNSKAKIPIYVIPMINSNIDATSDLYNTNIIKEKYYGLFMQNQKKKNDETNADTKYYLIGYLPMNYFWESAFYNSTDPKDKEAWRILLEDRLNNAINNSLAQNINATDCIDLHKDLNIFDISLSSSTSTTGISIPLNLSNFYEHDLGFYWQDTINGEKKGVYQLKYSPNVVDSDTSYYFSNYSNFIFDTSSGDLNVKDNMLYYNDLDLAYNNLYTAEYTKIENLQTLKTTWEKTNLYGTKGSTASMKIVANANGDKHFENINTVQSTDYFIYTKNNNEENVYKEISLPNNLLSINMPVTFTVGNNTMNTIDIINSMLQLQNGQETAAVELYYKEIINVAQGSNSAVKHPSIFSLSYNNTQQQYTLEYYNEISLYPYSPNIYAYYNQIPEFTEDLFPYFKSNSIPIYYKNGEQYILIQLNNYNTYDDLLADYSNKTNYYTFIFETNTEIDLEKKYYLNNQPIDYIYKPNTYYYFNNNYILDENSQMTESQPYYQLVSISGPNDNKFSREEQVLDYLSTFYYGNTDNNHFIINKENIGNEQNAFYIFINNNNLVITENKSDVEQYLDAMQSDNSQVHKVLKLPYRYSKLSNINFYSFMIDTNNNIVKSIYFKYPMFIKQNQDSQYTLVEPLSSINLDENITYYQKEYTLAKVNNNNIILNPATNSTPIYAQTGFFKVFFDTEFNAQTYYTWSQEERKGKTCNGNFSVNMTVNPYVISGKTNYKWAYGANENTEKLYSIIFSTTATTSTVKDMITPVYDYMTTDEAKSIFSSNSYHTTKEYEGFTSQITMSIVDKMRLGNTISLYNTANVKVIETSGSATNIPVVYALRKLLNRKNYFNQKYTTNYDYMNDIDAMTTTAAQSGIGKPYQHTTYSMIKNISLFDVEEQYNILSTTAEGFTIGSNRGRQNNYLNMYGTPDTTAVINFNQYPLGISNNSYLSTTAINNANNNNMILAGIVNKLNINDAEATLFNSATDFYYKFKGQGSSISDYTSGKYYWFNTETNSFELDNNQNKISSRRYYTKETVADTAFDVEPLLVRYLDNKKHDKITIKTQDKNYLDVDAWMLLQSYRLSWNNYQGTLSYLYLSPKKYNINSKQIYLYFIYEFSYNNMGELINIKLKDDAIIYYYNQTYGYAKKVNNELKVNNVDLLSILHFQDIYQETPEVIQKVYEIYTQTIEYWYKNPYPGGNPVFFEDWCVSNQKLESKYNANDTASRDYYYYSIKIPNTLNIELDDTYYQYEYYFDIMQNNNTEELTSVFSNKDSNNFLVTYSLVEDSLPKTTYDKKDAIDIGFKDSDNGYSLNDFMTQLHSTISQPNQTYYFTQSTDSTLSITDHDNIFNDSHKININKTTFKFYTKPENTYKESVYIKIKENDTNSTDEESDDEQIKKITLDNMKSIYYKYNNYDTFSLERIGDNQNQLKVNINYSILISDKTSTEENFTKYEIYKYSPIVGCEDGCTAEDILSITDQHVEKYCYKYAYKNDTDNYGIKNNFIISIPFSYSDNNPLYLEKFENNLGFRHTFLNIPNKKYTNSFTTENPYPNQTYFLNSDGCLVDNNDVDHSPNGTFSISSGNLDPGILVQIRGFNDIGEFTGDLNGGTLNNVTFGDGILHIKDTSDAWRKPTIDVIHSALKVKPESQGGNIYASIVTEGGISAAKKIKGERLYGAIWNDYAEYRETDNIEAGRCVIETGTGKLKLSDERLQGGANIVSDTFGMGVGETEIAKTPIAVSGRVLAYPYEDRNIFKPGDAVCSGPNGTISLMTREEIREWPDRIVGYVSEIPYYQTWGTGKVKVNNRIWIKIH